MSDLPVEVKENSVDTADQTLNDASSKLVADLVDTDDPKKIQDITALFNMANTKKNAVRVLKMGQLWDHAAKELLKRVKDHPENASNDDLIKLLTIAEGGMDKASKVLGNVDVTPIIQINQQNNTLNISPESQLTKEERDQILAYVRNTLASVSPQPSAPEEIDAEITEIKGDEESCQEEINQKP